jgi:hypothetical protein
MRPVTERALVQFSTAHLVHPLEPSEQATARGRAYLLEGTLDDLWERYAKDFESE